MLKVTDEADEARVTVARGVYVGVIIIVFSFLLESYPLTPYREMREPIVKLLNLPVILIEVMLAVFCQRPEVKKLLSEAPAIRPDVALTVVFFELEKGSVIPIMCGE